MESVPDLKFVVCLNYCFNFRIIVFYKLILLCAFAVTSVVAVHLFPLSLDFGIGNYCPLPSASGNISPTSNPALVVFVGGSLYS